MVFHSQIPGHDVAFCSTMSRSQQGLRSFRRPRPIEGPNRTISDRLRPRRNPFRFTHFHSDEMLAQPRAYKLSPTESGYRCNRPGSGMLRSTRLHAARSSQGPQFTRPAEGPPPQSHGNQPAERPGVHPCREHDPSWQSRPAIRYRLFAICRYIQHQIGIEKGIRIQGYKGHNSGNRFVKYLTAYAPPKRSPACVTTHISSMSCSFVKSG
jgi:hypothetical protein